LYRYLFVIFIYPILGVFVFFCWTFVFPFSCLLVCCVVVLCCPVLLCCVVVSCVALCCVVLSRVFCSWSLGYSSSSCLRSWSFSTPVFVFSRVLFHVVNNRYNSLASLKGHGRLRTGPSCVELCHLVVWSCLRRAPASE
jgi:hypothetical protein